MRSGKENGLLFPNTPGTSGQVLTSNGAGVITWATPATPPAPGGDTGDLQFNNAGVFAGAANANVENGYLKIITGLPTSSAAGGVIIGAKDLGTRIMPSFVGPNGLDTTIQPHMGRNKVYMIMPTVSAAAVTTFGGLPTPVLLNSVARTPASTNMLTSVNRIGFMTSTTAGTLAGVRTGALMWMRGTANGIGGFHLQTTFGIPDTSTTSTKRMFIGLYGTVAAPTNVEPTSLFNTLGVGKISSSTNLCIISNTSSGTGTAVDLGSGFPATGAVNAVYLFTLFSPAGGSFVGWRIDRLDTGTTQSGTITSTSAMPANNTMLCYTAWCTNNGLTNATGFDFSQLYLETDN